MATVRTIKLKRSSQAYGDSGSGNLASPMAPDGSPSQAEISAAPETSSAATSPAILSTSASAAVVTKTVSGKSTVWFMLIALFAVIGLAAILGLQFSEMSFYKADPSVWLPGK